MAKVARALDVCCDDWNLNNLDVRRFTGYTSRPGRERGQEGNRRTFTTAHEVSPLLEPVATFYVSGPADRFSPVQSGDVVFSHSGLQRSALQAEPGGCPIRSPDLAVGFL